MHPLPLLSLLSLSLVLSAPAPTPDNTIAIGPPGIADLDAGISISMYTQPACDESSFVQTVELQYNHPVAQQFHSYKLNGTFSEDQKVAIFVPANWKATGYNGVDKLAVGDVPIGCAEFVYNLDDNMRTEGCHSFDTMMGCVEVQVT